ncbi:MAG: efflux RND transporter periplasmic adaptor subunit [Bacteroidales bacterium]|jgi:cobalt-zinc-cadmium efflux system membrane fusion protein|nr:efflux RND transporter periplasmic adaptor subunit [Bacteroidales bacterium]
MQKIILPICLLVFYSCGNKSGNNKLDNTQYTVEGAQFIIQENSPVLQNLKFQKVESEDYRSMFTASGTVRAIPTQYAEIATPFAGRIVKSFVHPGQKVSVGSPIFELSSPTFFEIGKTYHQEKEEMELALKNLNREKDLLKNDVGVVKDVEAAEANYELKKKDYEQALAAIKVYQIDPDDRLFGQPLIVRSPIAGEVLKNAVVMGQYIREDADPLVIVADLNKVWVVAHVKEKDIHQLQNIADVEISLSALPNNAPVKGKIYYVSEMLDAETRSVEVIIECDNRDRQIKPFMYAAVKITSAPVRAIVIPNAAVLQDEDNRYVVVSEGQNRFRKANVKIIATDEKQTVVQSGINADDTIVTEGAFYFIDMR